MAYLIAYPFNDVVMGTEQKSELTGSGRRIWEAEMRQRRKPQKEEP